MFLYSRPECHAAWKKIDAHRDGYGFLLLADQEDIYLNEREMRQVFHGDEVLVTYGSQSTRGLKEN